MSLIQRLFAFTVSCWDTISDEVTGAGYIMVAWNSTEPCPGPTIAGWCPDAFWSFVWGLSTIFFTWFPSVGYSVYFTKKKLWLYTILSLLLPPLVPAVCLLHSFGSSEIESLVLEVAFIEAAFEACPQIITQLCAITTGSAELQDVAFEYTSLYGNKLKIRQGYVTMITVTISLVAFVQSHLTMFGSWWAKRFILSGIIRLFGWSFLVIYHMEIAALPFLLALICNLVIASSCKFNSAEIIVNSIGAIFSPFCIAIQKENASNDSDSDWKKKKDFLRQTNISVSVIQVIAILITSILVDTNNLSFPKEIALTNPELDQKGHYFNLNLTVFAGLIPLLTCSVLLSLKRYKLVAAAVAAYNVLCVIPVTISAATFSYEDNCFELSVFNLVNFTLFPLIILFIITNNALINFRYLCLSALSLANIVVGAVFIMSKYDIISENCSYPSLIYSVHFYTFDVIMFIVSFCICFADIIEGLPEPNDQPS